MSCRTQPINCESSLSAAKRLVCKRFVARKNHNRRDHGKMDVSFLAGTKICAINLARAFWEGLCVANLTRRIHAAKMIPSR